MTYPQVIGEFETIAAILTGKSIARFGDGELKLMDGKGYLREPECKKLGDELLSILQQPDPKCIVGIPTMDPTGPKYEGWIRHEKRFARLLNPEVQYYSAFITRPDSAPRINCIEYAKTVERIWRGKRVTVLCEDKDCSVYKLARLSAKKLKWIGCPHREAYAEIDRFENEIASSRPDVALLSCGPTATCLANRLAARGIHAVDIGSAGGYLLKLLNPKLQPQPL